MIGILRNFMRRLGGTPPQRHFGEDDQRLALAALLVHCMAIDGTVSDSERAKLEQLLSRTFGLSDDDLKILVADAVAADQEAVDLYRFTSILKRQMSETERIQVVENLWEIVFADGKSHEFEENLVWRIAELLSVNRQDRIARKRMVSGNRDLGGSNAE